jgi:hypothetical protein
MTANVVHPAELERMLEARVEAARQTRSAAQLKRSHSPRRRSRRSPIALVAGTLLALVAATVYGAITIQNVQVTDRLGYAKDLTDEGAIVEYIGDQNQSFGSSGSGIFDSFVRVQENDDEKGYNTDGDLEFDTKAGAFTHSIKVSEIPTVPCSSLDGQLTSTGLCFELFADLNESDSTKLITLDAFEIYFTTEGTAVNDDGDGPDLTGYPFSGSTTKVFDSDDQVRINDVNQGSGRGDLRYLVPVSGITIPGNCNYGSTTCTTYFVLYSEYGFADGLYDSDGGFEEWKVKRYPFLSVSKTATTTFTRTFAWTIDKSVVPASWALFDGDTGTSDWTVAVTKDNGTDSTWAVSGTITVNNPSSQTAIIASVTDQLTGGINATVNCGAGTFPRTLAAGGTLNCTYSSALPDGTGRTNTATATLTTGPVFTGTAAVTFGAPTTVVNGTVDVTDTNGQSWNDVTDDASFTYDETFECPDDAGPHLNTATITQTGQSDSATVTVTCYDLDVTKTAVESFSRDFDWTIEKSVDPTSLDLFDGDSDDVTWTVEWTKSAAQDSTYGVTGTITVDNNHPSLGAVINSVSDVITTSITATVNCGVGVTFPHTIAAGGSLVCTYSSDLPDGTTRTNTATATQQNHDYASDLTATAAGTTDYSDTESVDFTGVTPTVTDDTATLSDARPGNTIDGDNVSASGSASWDETFECGDDEGDHTNTATVTGDDDPLDTDSDDAMTTVNCHQLAVTKDADTSFDRDYDWTVSKTRVFATGEVDGDLDLTTLTIDPDQTYTLTYEITVDLAATPYTDSDWAVEGTINVDNPAPIDAEDVVITDVISGYGNADNLDCDPAVGEQTTVDISANSSVTCDYSSALPDATDRTNTATATLFGIGYDGEADVDFETADVTEIDECVVVTDDNGTPADTADDTTLDASLCASEAPETYTHTIDVGPFEVCGEFPFTNTAHIVTVDDVNDTGENHSDSYLVVITVPCPEGCTLTPGYWKTHNVEFWGGAPEDDNWYLIDPDGDGFYEGPYEDFFDTGMTWFEVFWTNPAGRPYYQLSFHYMAAVLNTASIEAEGGTIPTGVQDAIDDAAALLDEYDGSEAGKNPDLKGKNAKTIRAEFVTLAGILGSFNEGTYPGGPEHCDEDASSDRTSGQLLIADRRTSPSIG